MARTETRTTEDLRELLMDAMESVVKGDLDPADAKSLIGLSDKVIQTVRLELDYSQLVSRLDKDNQGINTGPVALITKSETD